MSGEQLSLPVSLTPPTSLTSEPKPCLRSPRSVTDHLMTQLMFASLDAWRMGVLLPLRGKPSQRQGEEPGPKLLLRQPSHLILHSGQGICALSAKPEGKRCKGEMWRPGEEVSPAGGGCWLLLKAPSQGPHLLGAKLALGLSAGPAGNHPLLSPSSLPGWKSDQNL